MELEQQEQKKDELEVQKASMVQLSKEGWINRHSKAITAWTAIGSFITTAVLATFAYLSWTEVQMQRGLTYKQFVVANAPSVRAYVTKGFQFDNDIGWMVWKASNQGGPVNDVIYKSIILCCGSGELQAVDTTKLIVRTALQQKLSRNENAQVKILVKDNDTIKWLKPFLDGKKYGLYLFVRAEYTIPPELSLTGKEKKDSTYRLSTWEPYKKSFEGVKPQYEKIILRLIEERGYLSIEHQG